MIMADEADPDVRARRLNEGRKRFERFLQKKNAPGATSPSASSPSASAARPSPVPSTPVMVSPERVEEQAPEPHLCFPIQKPTPPPPSSPPFHRALSPTEPAPLVYQDFVAPSSQIVIDVLVEEKQELLLETERMRKVIANLTAAQTAVPLAPAPTTRPTSILSSPTLGRREEELQNMRARLDSIMAENAQLSSKCAAQAARLDGLEAEIEAQRAGARTAAASSEASETIARLQRALDEKQDTLDVLVADLTDAAERSRSVSSELAVLTEHNASLASDLEAGAADRVALEDRVHALEQQLEGVKEASATRAMQIEQSLRDSVAAEWESRLEESRAAHEATAEKLDALEKLRDSWLADMEGKGRLSDQLTAVTERAARLQNDNKALLEQLGELRGHHVTLADEKAVLIEALDSEKAKVRRLTSELEAIDLYKSELARVQDLLHEESQTHQREIAHVASEVARLNRELTGARHALSLEREKSRERRPSETDPSAVASTEPAESSDVLAEPVESDIDPSTERSSAEWVTVPPNDEKGPS
ncbi:hypothetical protein BDK51DRAFT_46493, partial [Blyttiomyces helicus]